MKRTITPELLDTDDWASPQIETALADLRRINRLFGGIGTMTAILARVAKSAGRNRLTFLDVGGASGDVARGAQQRLRKRGLQVDAVILDRAPTHLQTSLPKVAGDGGHLPFADSSFDVVGCSLLAHHLSDSDLQAFVEEGLRVSRLAVAISDLKRSLPHLLLVYAGLPLFRSPLTHKDAPASVRAAYTEDEMRALLEATAAARVETFPHYLQRMGVIAWKA